MNENLSILIVDDDPDILDGILMILESRDYHLRTARDGLQCLDLLKEEIPDLLILDLLMPGMSGVDTGRALKQIKPDIKIFLSSGYPLECLSETTAMLEYEGFLDKPFGIDTLSEKLKI